MIAIQKLKALAFGVFCIGFPVLLFAQDLEDIPFDLPLFIINTNGQNIPNEPKITAQLGIINNSSSTNYFLDQYTDYDGQIGIEFRGNGSATWSKKSYLFETRTSTGDNNNVSLLGMPSENDWILYGSYIDKTGMRNVLTYDLAHNMGHYASRTAYCELIINGEYRGIYILMEKIKQDENRVNVPKFSDDNNSPDQGGYIIRTDSWWNNQIGWESSILYEENGTEWWPRYQYVYPKHDDINEDQKQFIQNYMLTVDEAIFNTFPTDFQSIYTDLIDLNSFVDLFIINELTKNPDGYRLSTFMHMDPTSDGGRLKTGPVWDYNFGYGNYINYQDKTHEWEYDNHWWEVTVRIPFWWQRFMDDKTFKLRLIDRWTELRHSIITHENFCAKIDAINLHIKNGIERNNQVWTNDIILEDFTWASTNTYEEEVDELKNWIHDRIEWIDDQIALMKASPSVQSNLVFPNPTSGLINIYFSLEESTQVKANIFDINGRLIYTTSYEGNKGENIFEINNFQASSGTYFLEHIINKERFIDKIVILQNGSSY